MIPLPNADVIFNLLARLVDGPDAEIMGYLGDALSEAGRDDLYRILQGLCPECGGPMRRLKETNPCGVGQPEKYYRCRDCRETDVDYADTAAGPWHLFNQRWRRVCRLLKVRGCPNLAHDRYPRPGIRAIAFWNPAPACPQCAGRGIIP